MTGLERFVAAQAPVWDRVRDELRAGKKQSHWMWFIFPQLRGLGRSPTAAFYGIADLDEARAYARHPVLGPRLAESAALMLIHADRPAEAILGPVDALKLCSSATLFARAAPDPAPFVAVLDAFCPGPCARTLALLDGRVDAPH